ncbi:MAG: hypothetical protein HYY93_08835 [Planctomycetes bacterium]|nr:hypothetical protein [Planctomycetota bacterium]
MPARPVPSPSKFFAAAVAAVLCATPIAGCMARYTPPRSTPRVLDHLPENPCPGETWCKVERPARYAEVSDKVLIRPATKRQVLEPPVYERECREVVVQKGYWAEIPVPARYEDVVDRVCVQPAHREWRKIRNVDPCGREVECYCVVEVPAVYQTRTRRVMCSPETVCKEWVPPVTRIENEPVEVEPACWRDIEEPPVYETQTHKVRVCPKETLYVKECTPCCGYSPCTHGR